MGNSFEFFWARMDGVLLALEVLCSSSLARAERSELRNSVPTGGSHMAARRSRATLVTRAILQRMNTNMLDGVSHISFCECVIFALVG